MKDEEIMLSGTRLKILTLSFGWFLAAGQVHAENNYSLHTYKCSEFLSDVGSPTNAQRLIKSMMMIAWATGYAAAHQSKQLKDDARSLQLIGALLGDICRQSPERFAPGIFAETIVKK